MKQEPVCMELVVEQLALLNVAYQNRKTTDELAVLSELFFDAFKGKSAKAFMDAVKLHIWNNRYFPTVAHIKDHYQQLVNRIPATLELPAQTLTPEQVDDNIKRIKRVIGSVTKSI